MKLREKVKILIRFIIRGCKGMRIKAYRLILSICIGLILCGTFVTAAEVDKTVNKDVEPNA